MKRIQKKLITIVTVFCFLAGCGGGDNKDPEPPPPPPAVENNWDSLIWDQGEWQ